MTRLSESLDLRPYQLESLDALRAKFAAGAKRLALIAPTGAGKTIIASAMAKAAVAKQKRVLFLAHRRELITQAVDKLARIGVDAGVIMAGEKPRSAAVQVASIQTLARREKPPADLIIVDEAHHSTSASWRKLLDAYPGAHVVGLTATPWRTDRVGLADLYQDSVLAATPAHLITTGALCAYQAYAWDCPDLHEVPLVAGEFNQEALGFAVNTSVLVGGVVREYLTHANGKRALVFAVNVEHSLALTSEFYFHGILARHVDYKTPKDERQRAIDDFVAGRVKVLSSVALFSEGFDAPAAEVCVMARPTMSVVLSLQMQGRVMRPSDGKPFALILDHGGNLLRHGLVDEERDYSLTATPARVADLHVCPLCRAVFGRLGDDGSCPKCHQLIAAPREIREAAERRRKQELEGERIAAEEIKRRRAEAAKQAPDSKKLAYYQRLVAEAREKNYKPTWIGMRFKSVFGHWPNFRGAA